MRSRFETTTTDLRRAIDSLPPHTRRAMLQGITENEIVAGAYSSDGGICPMLAAHRAGGRTSCIAFARAWDKFTLGTGRGARVSRPATPRELTVLRAHLEASLLADEAPVLTHDTSLGDAIAEHAALVEARAAREREHRTARTADANRQRPGDPNRAHQLRHRDGWSWTRPVRSLEAYQDLVAAAEEQRSEALAWALEDDLRDHAGRR